ncbi:hypothetical protein Poli38472_003755 [Pythium oligandrum]|uniref:Uncharacterized protein n=1 Tax=Pythium oligandrum TaxID=41045 RepID=A0A8K1CNS0_PYTOL|nr:hypothetical protein Poli38472_003755 [Pythium oligandrum]|eukprot:TMW65990.1 hypothetical protein Poli38472_003755 [Pythium oligandrum]
MQVDKTHVVPKKWEASRIQSLKNKLAVITGGNTGIGYETALQLARHGANVVLACRNESKGTEAIKKLEQELANVSDAGKLEFMQLDVSDLGSVKRFSDAFHKTHDHLDLLINNAGIMAVPYEVTVDGLESQMATNHLGHFALTSHLFDLLKASPASRVVSISSWAHRHTKGWDEDNMMRSKKRYSPLDVYADTKLINIIFTLEFARRLRAQGVTNVIPVVCHPGSVITNLFSAPIEKLNWFQSLFWRIWSKMPIYQSVQVGALPTLYAATASGVQSGNFIGTDGFRTMWGHPKLEDPHKLAKSESAGRKVWEQSEQLTSTPFVIA